MTLVLATRYGVQVGGALGLLGSSLVGAIGAMSGARLLERAVQDRLVVSDSHEWGMSGPELASTGSTS